MELSASTSRFACDAGNASLFVRRWLGQVSQNGFQTCVDPRSQDRLPGQTAVTFAAVTVFPPGVAAAIGQTNVEPADDCRGHGHELQLSRRKKRPSRLAQQLAATFDEQDQASQASQGEVS